MKKKSLKGSSLEELNKMHKDAVESLRTFHFNLTGSKTKNVREGRAVKRQIARIKTEINTHKK